MNYNPTPFPNPYLYPQFQQQFQPKVPGYSGQVVQVSGRAGAEALPMEPNSSIYVQDNTQGNRIFLCITDGAGYKTVRGIIGVFEEEHAQEQQDNAISALEARIKTLEDRLNEHAGSNAARSSGADKPAGRQNKTTN